MVRSTVNKISFWESKGLSKWIEKGLKKLVLLMHLVLVLNPK